jgi:hypothetical protein
MSESEIPRSVTITLHADPNTPEAIEFYRWLGICIGNWAYIDRRLYQIFHHATGFDQKQSALIYYGNRAFNQRLRMVDNSIRMFWPKEQHKAEWRPIYDKVESLSHTRNIFAHQPTMRRGTARDGKPFDIYSIHIEPYERVLNNDYPGLLGKDELGVEDLRQHDLDITQLEELLHNFAWHLGGERAARKTLSANRSPSANETSGK